MMGGTSNVWTQKNGMTKYFFSPFTQKFFEPQRSGFKLFRHHKDDEVINSSAKVKKFS